MASVTTRQQLRASALISYVAIVLSMASGVLYTPWMIAKIGQSDYGLYTLADSLIAFIAIDFGLGTAVSKFLSAHRAASDVERERQFLGIAFRLFSIVALVLTVVLVALYFRIDSIYAQLNQTEIERLKVIYVITGLYVVAAFPFKPLEGMLVAYEEFVFMRSLDLATKALTVGMIVGALFFGKGLYAVVGLTALVRMIRVLVELVYVRRRLGLHVDLRTRDRNITTSIFQLSAWTTTTSVASRFTFLVAPTILGALSGSNEIAVFGVASTIEGYAYSVAYAFQGLFLPRVARILHKDQSDMASVEDLMIRVGRFQILVLGLVVVGFILLGDEFFRLWIGAGFDGAYAVALLLIVPGIIYYTQEIAQTTLLAMGKVHFQAYARILMAVVSVALSVALASKYGALGAGIGICAGSLAGNAGLMNVVYSRLLGLNMWRFYRECHGRWLPVGLLTLGLGIGFGQMLPAYSWALFGMQGIAIVLVYVLGAWFFYLRADEKQMILGRFRF